MKWLWLVLALAIPFLLLYGLGRLSRWYVGRRDPIDALIGTPKWRKDGDGYMDTVDHQKLARAGEVRWQETVRAQRKTRKPAPPRTTPVRQNVIVIDRTRRRA